MQKNQHGQPDLVLENRQVLWIFFGIVALCGIFFSLGYVVGRNTFSPLAAAVEPEPDGGLLTQKPSAMPPPVYMNRPPAEATRPPESSDSGTNLSFYESVEEKKPEAALLPPESPSASGAPAASSASPLPPSPPGILVQVSALTRREDADALVALLMEKNLPVLVTSGANDSFFHVVVGPYKNEKDAQLVKMVLEQEGFRPIIKR